MTDAHSLILAKGVVALAKESSTEPYSTVVVQSGAEKFRSELTSRLYELVDWCHGHPSSWVSRKVQGKGWQAFDSAKPCSVCSMLGGTGNVVLSCESNIKPGHGFGNGMLNAHDHYHLGVALTAIRNEEYKAAIQAKRDATASAWEEKQLARLAREIELNQAVSGDCSKKNERRRGKRFTERGGYNSCGHRSNPHRK